MMRKHLFTTALVGLLALAALAVPAAASASPVLDYGWNEAVPAGEPMEQSSSWFEFTGGSTIFCEHAELAGTVSANSGSEIVQEITSGSFTEGAQGYAPACVMQAENRPVRFEELTGLPWCYSSTTLGSAVLKSCESSTLGLHLTISLPSLGTSYPCTYTAEKLTPTYNTGGSQAFSSFSEKSGYLVRQTGNKVICPAKLAPLGELGLTSLGSALHVN